MLQFLISLLLLSEAQMTDKALVNGVKSTFAICTDIVEAVGDFLSIFEEKRRRADSLLGKKVTQKLMTCRKLVELVDGFRKKHFSPPKSPQTSTPTSPPTSPPKRSKIRLTLNESQYLDKLLKLQKKKLGETIFVASQDGDSASAFHKKCDDQGPTVVLVESKNGAVFGGYSDQSWKATGYKRSTVAFLFRLRPIRAKYPLKSSSQYRYAIHGASQYGPKFGSYDLRIGNKALRYRRGSQTRGGFTYNFPKRPDFRLNNGVEYFQVKDYVVMKAIKM
jgi:hypothetical protein